MKKRTIKDENGNIIPLLGGLESYRKKPVEVFAVKTDRVLYIETLEGTMKAEIGDWVIYGTEGEPYPCKEDAFRSTYVRVDIGVKK
ncbi:MAG: hypothetical protein V3U02_12235 [Calditrichia bacterium]